MDIRAQEKRPASDPASRRPGHYRMRATWRIGVSELALALVFGLLTPSIRASIFMRLGRGTTALEQLGGMLVHRADVRINGQPGRLSVYGFDVAPDLLIPDLRKALHFPELIVSGSTLVTHIENGQATSLFLLPDATSSHTVAMLIEQSADAYEKAHAAPNAWPDGLSCPGADLLFSAENDETRTAVAVASSEDSPEVVAQKMDSTLAGSGWVRVPPFSASAGLTLYSRGKQVCAVTATGDPGGRTRITMLQRLGRAP